MNLGFWEKLKKPIIVLAPMADVTDAAFRRVIAKYGKPDVMWTEFVSADGLFLGTPRGRRLLRKDLIFHESERPIVAQIFTSNPERMKKAAALIRRLGFDGIDINMGCPHRGVEKQIAGAALIKHPKLARELILAAKEGAKSEKGGIPVSVKTRIGYHKNEIETWLPNLLESEPAVITLHVRTRKEMSKVPADWSVMKKAIDIRNASGKNTLIFGNGDVQSRQDAFARAKESGCDGVMIGRGVFGNPWVFADFAHIPCGCKIEHPPYSLPVKGDEKEFQKINLVGKSTRRLNKSRRVAGVFLCNECGGYIVTSKEKIKVLAEHVALFDEILGKTKSFPIMKKHFKAYISGWEGAKDLRSRLMETKSAKEAISILKK